MANKKRKCKQCGEYKLTEEGIKTPLAWFCCRDHAVLFAQDKQAKQKKKQIAKAKQSQAKKEKAARADLRARKKEIMTRSQWYDKLQKLVNQWVKFRDKDQPCCTCGTTNQKIKYDAGHFIPQKGYDPRRFELTNIHKQCSMQCNQHGSGKRAEYREFIKEKYGEDHLFWIESEVEHKPLKEVFPHWSDIEKEIIRYRKLLRENGIKPIV